jgi:hypothetical protein
MSDYIQPYQIAFAGLTPPLKPHVCNDEFTRQHPLFVVGAPYVALDPKWVAWNPGASINTAAIDTARQMAFLSGAGDKAWGGRAQALPLPAAGQAVQYTIYMRMVQGFVEGEGAAPFNELLWGLVLGEDLIGAPATSPFWSLAASIQNPGPSPTVALDAVMETAAWANYNAVNVPDAIVATGWPLTYMRARMRQALSGGLVWNVSIAFDISATGEGWQRVQQYDGITNPVRHVAFAQRSVSDQGMLSFCDFVRLELQSQGDLIRTSGDRQHLGSV